MTKAHPLIAVVDDEHSICVALQRLIRAAGMDVETYSSEKMRYGGRRARLRRREIKVVRRVFRAAVELAFQAIIPDVAHA